MNLEGQAPAISAGYNSEDDRDDFNIIFFHKALDDFGLDPYSFRVYARIVRRAGKGESWESNKNMAIGCRMSEAQIKKSLNLLVKHGLIIKESRPGTTCLYRVAPRRNWSNPIPPNEPSNTDSYNKANRNGGVNKDTNCVRLATTELGGSYQVARGVATTKLQSISNRSKSNKHTQEQNSVCVSFSNSSNPEEVTQDLKNEADTDVPSLVNNSPVLKSKNCATSLDSHKAKIAPKSLNSQETKEEIMRRANIPSEDWEAYLNFVASTLKNKSVGAALTAIQNNPARAGLEYETWKKQGNKVAYNLAARPMDEMPDTFHITMRHRLNNPKMTLEKFFTKDYASEWFDWALNNKPEWIPARFNLAA